MLSHGIICKVVIKEQHEIHAFGLQTVAIEICTDTRQVVKDFTSAYFCDIDRRTRQDSTCTSQASGGKSSAVCKQRASGPHTHYTVSPCEEVTATRYCCRKILISLDRSRKSLLNESSCTQIFREEISKYSHGHITPVRI